MLVKEVVMIKRVNYVLFTYFFLTSYDIMMTWTEEIFEVV